MIIEDQPHVRKDIQILVEKQKGFSVVGSAGTVKEAKGLILTTQPDVLLLDIQLSDGLGFDILKDASDQLKIIFLTAFENHAIKAIKHGALDYLLKPVDEEELSQALIKALKFFPTHRKQLTVARKYHRQELG